MQNLGQQLKTNSKKKSQINPFAQALAEREKNNYGDAPFNQTLEHPLNEAFARTGGQNFNQNLNSPEEIARTQKELRFKQIKERLRQKLHDQINPVDKIDVFNARKREVEKKIEQIRKELKLLTGEIAKLNKEVDIAVTKKVVNPGQEGQYYLNFFAKLRRFIMMLRAKVKSARAWAKQTQAKKKKIKRGPGLEFRGSRKAETVHMILDNNELNNAYSGG